MGKQEKIIVYTDGGARGNPGPAAIAVVIKDVLGDTIRSYGEAIGVVTNNEAEYRAVILALEKIKAMLGKQKVKNLILEVRMDSELVSRQLTGEYKIEEEKLFPFFIKIWNLRIEFGDIKFKNIPRERNREADGLVNQVLDKEQKSLFK